MRWRGRAALRGIVSQSTPWHSTAQHGTAWHGSRDGTVQRSIVGKHLPKAQKCCN